MNGEDILFAMTSLGFENYAEALKIYLAKYREVCSPFLPIVIFRCMYNSGTSFEKLTTADSVERRRIQKRSVRINSSCRFVINLGNNLSDYTVEASAKSNLHRKRPRQLYRRLWPSHRKWGQRCRRLLNHRSNSTILQPLRINSSHTFSILNSTRRGIG